VIVYEFDLIPDIYGLDWIGSEKWTYVSHYHLVHFMRT